MWTIQTIHTTVIRIQFAVVIHRLNVMNYSFCSWCILFNWWEVNSLSFPSFPLTRSPLPVFLHYLRLPTLSHICLWMSGYRVINLFWRFKCVSICIILFFVYPYYLTRVSGCIKRFFLFAEIYYFKRIVRGVSITRITIYCRSHHYQTVTQHPIRNMISFLLQIYYQNI